jgi:hypothetical protein
MHIRLWTPGERPVSSELEAVPEAGGVVHIDVELGADPAAVYEVLGPICGPDLTLDMVVDLLDPDLLPKVTHHDEDRRIRAVSAFGVEAVDPGPDSAGCAGRLTFELVEFLANDHWLVTCCHSAKSYAGAGACQPRSGRKIDHLIPGVTRRWEAGGFSSAGDLGVLMLHELASSYSGAWRRLASWLDRWERLSYDKPDMETDSLKAIRGLMTEFRSRLNALNVPQDEAGEAWFGGVTNTRMAERADRHIDRALAALDRLEDMLRSAFSVLHLKLAQQNERNADDFNRKLNFATAVFLVPTLIAGTWGENTWVPGENRPWGFVLTLAVMLAGIVVANSLLRKGDRR